MHITKKQDGIRRTQIDPMILCHIAANEGMGILKRGIHWLIFNSKVPPKI